jgi:MoxR-like ATPase
MSSKPKLPTNHDEIVTFVHDCYKLKPADFVMTELKWKYLVRSALRGLNILLLGDTGSGKTLAAQTVMRVLGKENVFFPFSLGAMQDPRSSLIGNTHFKKDTGTLFGESEFIRAIRTPGAVILLDEVSRCHPDGWNILLSVLDPLQRYVRLDEKEGSETVRVADGVCFIGTANVGVEYTSTRTMDAALLNRFPVKIESDILTQEQEYALLSLKFPGVEKKMLEHISKITSDTRVHAKMDGARISTGLSTRLGVEMASLAYDGFDLTEIAEAIVYPNYSPDGGNESERTYVKQLVQKYTGTTGGTTKKQPFSAPSKNQPPY